ncbi:MULTISPECIES: hypothetical protein [unclassified Agarivorans]|uniref:hypothetical protein n=1 Tax=unclassified Agarivorans TaxID=2636026 RepID=UPI0026E22694|nr:MULTISPECIES: hypothetical protein [unclassified Agarivorans]MDO6686596.1 hypothetical protein [Agarivorans sp. 3_MG-2023]MDO6715414.1 hypothetical protein [Agarivorans sp. 2_MG-2023]
MDWIALLAAATIIASFIFIIYLSNRLTNKWFRYALRLLAAPLALMTIVIYTLALDMPLKSSEKAGAYLLYLAITLAVVYLFMRHRKKSKAIAAQQAS